MHPRNLLPAFPACFQVTWRRWKALFLGSGCAVTLTGCDPGDREATVTESERRELVLWDQAYPQNIRDSAPLDWRRVPWTRNRYYNYRFGAEQDGEVWLSVLQRPSLDAVLLNVNRWYNQFRLPEITSLENLPQRPMLETTGYLVEAEGTYHPGMGADPRPETKMLAAAIPIGNIIVTIKMIGSPSDVEGQKESFGAYCEALKFFDKASIPEPDEES